MTDFSLKKKEITKRARDLVDILVSKGCSITEASKLAGYKGNSARVSASKMLRKPEVQEYYLQEVRRKITMGSSKAINKLMTLSAGAKSEYVQLEASKDILDRSGFKAPEKHQHLVAGELQINIDLS